LEVSNNKVQKPLFLTPDGKKHIRVLMFKQNVRRKKTFSRRHRIRRMKRLGLLSLSLSDEANTAKKAQVLSVNPTATRERVMRTEHCHSITPLVDSNWKEARNEKAIKAVLDE